MIKITFPPTQLNLNIEMIKIILEKKLKANQFLSATESVY